MNNKNKLIKMVLSDCEFCIFGKAQFICLACKNDSMPCNMCADCKKEHIESNIDLGNNKKYVESWIKPIGAKQIGK